MNEDRYEIKFILNESGITHAQSLLAQIGANKKYQDRDVNSLYFDNLNLDAVRDNLSVVLPQGTRLGLGGMKAKLWRNLIQI